MVNGKETNLVINHAIVEVFKNNLLGSGAWGKKVKQAMREKLYISRKQYTMLEPPLSVPSCTPRPGVSTLLASARRSSRSIIRIGT